MTSRLFAFFLHVWIIFYSKANFIDQCTDVHIKPQTTPETIINSIQQCFEQTNQPISTTQNIADILYIPLQNTIKTILDYESMQEKITNEDFDTRRSIKNIQKELVQYYFEINTKINQIDLPIFHHNSMEHTFFKIKQFLKNSNQTAHHIQQIQKAILNQKNKILNISSNVYSLDNLRQKRSEAQQDLELKLRHFRNAIRAQYHEKQPR